MLKITNLSKKYGDKAVLENLSLTFNGPGVLSIMGASGIGKTTLLRIISGIDKKYTGYVFGDNRQKVSYCFQEYRLFPNLTALENITKSVWESVSETNIAAAKEMLLDLGFQESDFSLFPDELSGGMKQRVSIARAFLREAPILILDEPTKELDNTLSAKILKMIEEEAKKRLVIMVTHNESDLYSLTHTVIDLNTLK